MSFSESESVLELLLRNWVAALVIGAAVVLPICAVLTQTVRHSFDSWRKSHDDERRAEGDRELVRLKQSMVDRGMTADEIERILRSGGSTSV